MYYDAVRASVYVMGQLTEKILIDHHQSRDQHGIRVFSILIMALAWRWTWGMR